MVKRDRHAAILEVIREERITNQERLRERLAERGFEVAQATLSRDINELRLVKVPDAEGSGHYVLPHEWEKSPPLENLLPILFVSVGHAGNLVVVRTLTGGAQAVAEAIDWEEWPEILGTVAGDDTILIVCREGAAPEEIHDRIREIAGVT